MSSAELRVVDNPEQQRVELWLAEERVGLADYSIADGVMTVPHVETDPKHRGQGFAAVLMDGVVAHARGHELTIQPVCPYAASFMRDRPDTHDMVAR